MARTGTLLGDAEGRERVALRMAGRVTPCDVSGTGDLLLTRDNARVVIVGQGRRSGGARSLLVRSVGSRRHFAGWRHRAVYRIQ